MHPRICILVILAIILTLTDIIGFLHFWGITIDIISCINIVLAIGLCVDYSVHICHAFLVAKVDMLDIKDGVMIQVMGKLRWENLWNKLIRNGRLCDSLD